ncbi:unnamed protein product [Arabidopsis arenosa]|uniref:Protein RRC1-like n=1 Tax=Arabidopsis arenosa TaxID=38785 RepID=A0A8S2AGB5_ARAAE|nr:unnamed protein product [Arabidopsis arenosa]
MNTRSAHICHTTGNGLSRKHLTISRELPMEADEEETSFESRAEDETARLYQEFVESFQGDNAAKTFVRGGTINPNDNKLKPDSQGEKSRDGASISKKGSREEERSKERENGKTRNIDHFMEEMKREQEMRERRNQDRENSRDHRFDELPDDYDPTGRFGPIASVKIMWPRTEEEKRRERHCGFVGFMNRADGQAAKDEMQGIIVYEYELKIGWGKAVSLPSQALSAPPPGHMAIRSKERCNLIFSGTSGPPITSVPNQNSELVLTPNVPDITVVSPEDEHLKHIIDTMALNVLDGGCAFEQAIMERGRGNPLFNFLFELGSKEHTYYIWRLYSFAQGDTLQRWRTEPYIMIAGSGRWIPPPQPATRSPNHGKESTSTYAAGKSRRTEAEQTLTDSQRDEFEDMLRALTLERSQIKEAMGFALDNADAAGEVVEVLTESLTLKETSIPTKVARLMLVSDILHNSSAHVKNASAYRTKFEATLPDIMESFNDIYRSVTGRITAEALSERVLKVLQVWADWFLFSDAYINGLRATFLRSGSSGVTSFHSICGDAPDIEKKGLMGNMNYADKINQDAALAMGEGAARQELLNLPMSELERRCRHNGLSLVGGREMMVARLLSLEDAEKQRGYEVVDENAKYRQGHSTWEEVNIEPKRIKTSYDKVETKEPVNLASTIPIPQPELKAFVKKEKNDLILPTSSWARDDDEQKKSYSSGNDNAGGITFKTDEEDLNADPSVRIQPENEINEEQRQKLRRIEVALIEYRESLEEQGMKNSEEIERKVVIHRKRLEADGLSGNQRVLPEKREKREDSRDSSRKRYRSESQNRSQTPPQKSLTRERVRDHDLDKDRHKDRNRQQHDLDKDRERRAKSSSHERDDHDRSRERDRDWRRRGMR